MRYTSTCIFLIIFSSNIYAQNLFDIAKKEMENDKKNTTVLTIATFKSTRLINGQSVETLKKGLMDVRIHHRFGFLSQGINDLYGLETATGSLGLDFGLTNRLMVGFSRSSFQRQLEGFLKYRLLRQSEGKVVMPLSLTLYSSMVLRTGKQTTAYKTTVSDRTSYVYQLLIARKFNEGLSLQLMPTFIHFNMVYAATDPNDLFSLGIGGRQKISKRISLNAEYYYQFDKFSGYYNSSSIGVDIETGGHVFQLHFTNSTGMTEPTFIHQTTGRWDNGDIHFGFNVSRVFDISKKKKSIK